ncbi:MAG: alkaline phosphatase family protein [Candidatus Dormibacteria bacterium]
MLWGRLGSVARWIAITAVLVGTGGSEAQVIAPPVSALLPIGSTVGDWQTQFGHPDRTRVWAAPSPTAASTPAATVGPTPAPTAAPSAAPTPTSSLPHVLVLLEENKGYASVVAGAPYLDSLAKADASSSAWFGVDHPSTPNYLALLSGSTQHAVGDCTPPGCGPYSATSLGGQLSAAGIPWAAYMESMPSPCFTGASAGNYVERHDPFVYFDDVLQSGCASHVLPYPGSGPLLATLDAPSAPDFVWITPNLIDDMHSGSVAQGDAWAQANLAPILASSWFRDYHSTLIITMDEGDAKPGAACCGQPPGGQIPLIVVSNAAAGRGSLPVTGDHYGTLRSIDEVFGLPLLGAAADPLNGDVRSWFG